jgi:uncharacterized RDD family membrane protein YckC
VGVPNPTTTGPLFNVGELASPARRLGAGLLDGCLPALVFWSIVIGAAASHSTTMFVVLILGYGVWAFVLFARGMTPGKWTLGTQVVKRDGRPADFLTMFVREAFGKPISGLVFMLGWIWILIDKDRQGWHDKLVGTYVVRRAAGYPDLLTPPPVSINAPDTPVPTAPQPPEPSQRGSPAWSPQGLSASSPPRDVPDPSPRRPIRLAADLAPARPSSVIQPESAPQPPAVAIPTPLFCTLCGFQQVGRVRGDACGRCGGVLD